MPQPITNALTTCGVLTNTTGLSLNGNNTAEMIDADVFNDYFNTCVDLKFSRLEDSWKTYSGLVVAKGSIRIRPRTKINIKAFLQ